MNYKIKVNSEAESKEVQDLFAVLGYEEGECSAGNYPALIIATIESRYQKTPYSSRAIGLDHEAHSQYKEITIPELRDLVVLKRNSIDDATHENNFYCYIGLSDGWYYFDMEVRKWLKSISGKPEYYGKLNPIEKPMKEYLRKNNDGEYILEVTDEREAQEPHAKHWIEVPSGMNIYWKEDGEYWFTAQVMGYRGAEIIWQRHPEETLKDKVASAEMARQESKERDLGDYSFNESDTLIKSNVEQSSIVKTLAERQSTYGDFSKVAEMTQGLLFVMSQYGYSDMPDTHKESIHMIASKLARIVNGDNNHLDSWHDIGGYSKLIENLIKSDDDNS